MSDKIFFVIKTLLDIAVSVLVISAVCKSILTSIIPTNSNAFARQEMENNGIKTQPADNIYLKAKIKKAKKIVGNLLVYLAFATIIWALGYNLYCIVLAGINNIFHLESDLLDCLLQTGILLLAGFWVNKLFDSYNDSKMYKPTNEEKSVISTISLISASILAVSAGISNYPVTIAFIIGTLLGPDYEAWNVKERIKKLRQDINTPVVGSVFILFFANILATLLITLSPIIELLYSRTEIEILKFILSLPFISSTCIIFTIEMLTFMIFEKKIEKKVSILKVNPLKDEFDKKNIS